MKSIYDGWTRQIKGRSTDSSGGYCARGFVWKGKSLPECLHIDAEIRVGRWILANLNPPEFFVDLNSGVQRHPRSSPEAAIVWANDSGALDPDGFRMVDLLTQGYVPEVTNEVPEKEEVRA